ncbi:MAG: hypothetical protein K8H87_18560 [Pseudorhodoplanes sp.]|nr:hypothetical protein [Pseudorhodoplanes sp.]
MSKTFAAAFAALTLVTAVAVSGGQAQAKGWKTGVAVGVGVLAGAAIASHAYGAYGAYGAPVYVGGPAYRECRAVARYDAWGNYIRTVRVCDVPYGW